MDNGAFDLEYGSESDIETSDRNDDFDFFDHHDAYPAIPCDECGADEGEECSDDCPSR